MAFIIFLLLAEFDLEDVDSKTRFDHVVFAPEVYESRSFKMEKSAFQGWAFHADACWSWPDEGLPESASCLRPLSL